MTYAVIILAGGTGERLGGVDKAALSYRDATLLDHVLSVVDDAAQKVVVGPEKDLPGVVWAREDPPGGGPLAGLAAGLAKITEDWVAVLAVDQPGLTADTIARLRATGRNAVLKDDRVQWLIGCWNAADLRAALPGDPRNLPLRKTLLRLDPVEVSALPGEARDVDTPADLDTLHSG
ncbi:molybdenum cofactor guanylyltransferase [Lentzea flaviverrucosa]|uniref:Molybdopterin-guanine dinucleotide biosynthesis protein A n=1 Tax=Lentzea flaviverrucosa TaxID=200379 RepID=A0A1H9X9H1_9PSEU|nr:NTP transferase domain-containing protein [Lentzea flaviverrucosa]RDI21721.1 molybdopterin-guanine dinucleotide biosynthesis protein A [Lentzea flaviverrucosa]SES42846.1 Molybdopterin-guanine dinucleotide biosynthesis protein A [Lentzea flaviverrucosa]